MIVKFFLTSKPWVLFILIVLPQFWQSPSPLQEFVRSAGMVMLCGWFYSIITTSNLALKEKQLELDYSKWVLVHCLLLPIAMWVILHYASVAEKEEFGTEVGIISFAGLYFFTGLFLLSKRAAISIAALEGGKIPKLNDWIFYCIAFLIQLVGVWILQPRVKLLLVDSREKTITGANSA